MDIARKPDDATMPTIPTTPSTSSTHAARGAHVHETPGVREQAPGLLLGLSPYHLYTREVPAMCALILGDHVATLLPEPPEGATRDQVKHAALALPRYFRLLDAWRWSEALWRAGVLSSQLHDESPLSLLDGVYRDIAGDPHNAVLARLSQSARELRIKSPAGALDAMCSDLMRGGPDPGQSIAITAAVDRCCADQGGWAVRGAVDSLTQRAETLLARKVFSFAMPLLTQGDGEALLGVRTALAAPLADLRVAMTATMSHVSDPDLGEHLSCLARAVSSYRLAFERWSTYNAQGDDRSGQRLVSGYVNVTGVHLPSDAALRSARAAAGVPGAARSGSPESPALPLLPALIVREMNARPV